MQKISYDLMQDLEVMKNKCDKHNKSLVKVRTRVLCVDCVKEAREEKERLIVSDAVNREHLRRTVETLSKDSMCSDKSILKADFSNYEVSNEETNKALIKSKELAERYLDENMRFNTILTGNAGTGKSHLAMSMLKYVNDHDDFDGSCLFISTNELMRRIKDSFNNRESRYTEANMIKLLGDVDLLVLDDLGSESTFRSKMTSEATEYTQNVLFGVLERRDRTIITTNLSSSELTEIYNSKIVSRLYRGLSVNDVIKFTEATKDKRIKFDF